MALEPQTEQLLREVMGMDIRIIEVLNPMLSISASAASNRYIYVGSNENTNEDLRQLLIGLKQYYYTPSPKELALMLEIIANPGKQFAIADKTYRIMATLGYDLRNASYI